LGEELRQAWLSWLSNTTFLPIFAPFLFWLWLQALWTSAQPPAFGGYDSATKPRDANAHRSPFLDLHRCLHEYTSTQGLYVHLVFHDGQQLGQHRRPRDARLNFLPGLLEAALRCSLLPAVGCQLAATAPELPPTAMHLHSRRGKWQGGVGSWAALSIPALEVFGMPTVQRHKRCTCMPVQSSASKAGGTGCGSQGTVK